MYKKTILLCCCIGLSLVLFHCTSQPDYSNVEPWLNPTLDIETRLDTLVAAMTLEEKVAQMMDNAPAIERLGVPQYGWWNECLHGVARSGLATVFPQAIGLAATWDEDMILRVAEVISDEGRAKHHEYVRQGKRGIYQGLTFWTPNINIFRDPRWGRGMETYGEDPFLTGRLAVNFVRGLQGNHPKYLKAVATVKHYAVHSGPEPERHTFDAVINERDLRQTYLEHFRMAIMEANVYSVMCAYNRYLGEACCGSDRLLNQIMRDEWGFEGYVVSDCGAISDIYRNHKIVETAAEAAALAVKSGTDLNCGRTYRGLVEAVEKGFITEDEIDVAVRRLFRARIKLGMFDPPEIVPYALIPYSVVDSEENRTVALETARKSMVLLKNADNTLPFSKDIKVAVIGPNAHDVEVLLGNYNGTPSNPVTPLQGIRNKIGDERVIYALGCEWAENLPVFEVIPGSALLTPDGQPGLKAEIFNNTKFEGDPVATRVDATIDFNWWDGAPIDSLDSDNFGVRWTGKLVPPADGWYVLGGEGYNAFRVFFEGKELLSFRGIHHARKVYEQVVLKAGVEYDIQIDFWDYHGDATMQLLWSVPDRDYKAEALAAVDAADAAVLCLGLSPRLEGEEMRVEVEGFRGGDRLTLDLPKIQQDLMQAVVEKGKPTVLVLLNGSAVAVNWADANIPALLEAWYPGQAAGDAIADVLFGDYNPAGRLPVTFYKSVDQLPPFEDYNMIGQTYRYFSDEPLYQFGHGLSYTTFEYTNLQVPESIKGDETIDVSVDVTNTGKMPGEEVVQLYVTDVEASVPVPVRSLQGFRRISLAPGEKKTVTFSLTPYQLSLLDKDDRRLVEPGLFRISVGGSQPENTRAVTTQTVAKEMTVTSIAYL
ncbi:glycoside hydrolase family 3 protein [candidate division KSB1 bacterium]|nr:glycoside hydrolase family 3 C-terminal domain-containing protein [candidate division KSB1 bacterium]RQW01945.1 MAG: glycoside hydrolase family 3 protein [candidate division KSB1 bacterium]